MKTSAGTNATAGVGLARRLFSRVLSAFSTLLQPAVNVLRSEQGRQDFSCVPVITPQLGRAKPAVLLMAAAIFTFVFVALLAPRAAEARGTFINALMTNYSPSTNNIGGACYNCHADWGGKEVGYDFRASFVIWRNLSTATPLSTDPVLTMDPDHDGVSTHTEWTNSISATRPNQTAASPNPALNWWPNYPDKDGDGCPQMIYRGVEVGMPVPQGTVNTGDFLNYAPRGWDIDDNDAAQGCSATFAINSVGTTLDTTAPGTVTDLRAASLVAGKLPLVWTAPGDDGATAGGATGNYDLRYTTTAITGATYNVRLPSSWDTMYDIPDTNATGNGGTYISKTGVVEIPAGGDKTTFNKGVAAPLMRAMYEPVPSTPGSDQTCTAANSPGVTCVAGASFTLESRGIPLYTTNVIQDGTTYWVRLWVSDGVLKVNNMSTPTGSPTFTENISASNIVAITAGAAGTGVGISSIAPLSVSGTGNSASITFTATGFGLNLANTFALTNSAGTIMFSPTSSSFPGTTATGTFACSALVAAPGTYNLELRSGSTVKAAWINAITIAAGATCAGNPPTLSSVSPNVRGQGATGQTLSLVGSLFADPMTISFSDTNIAGTVVVNTTSTATATIAVGAAAVTGTVSVATGAGSSNELSFQVTAAPTITCTPPAPPAGSYGTPYTWSCVASGGSGTGYTWTVPSLAGTPGLGSAISGPGNNTVTISGTPTAPGTVNGNLVVSDSNAGTRSLGISIVINKANQTITAGGFSPATLQYGGTSTVSATASSGLAVTLASTTPTVCTIAGSTVTAVNVGACTIAATQGGDTNYNAATTVNQSITVGKADQTITATCTLSLVINTSGTCSGSATSGLAVVFTSTTPTICTVSGTNGTTVTATSTPGTCTIAANQVGNTLWNAAPTVNTNITVTSVALTPQTITITSVPVITVGTSGTITATGGASGNPVTFSSTTPAICSSTGTNGSTITGLLAGPCNIAANQAGNATYSPAPTVNVPITVGMGVQTISTITFTPATLIVGGTTTVSATATSGLAVTFSSTTPLTCSVAGSTVTGVAGGTCTIAANQAGNANYNAAPQVTSNITVGKADQTIGAITFTPATLAVGGTTTVSATATSGLAVTFSSTTLTVCTVVGSTVTGVAGGTCTIAANQAGNASYNAAPQVTNSVSVLAVPGAPTNVVGTAITNTQDVSVAFTAPASDGGSAITLYMVSCSPACAGGAGVSSPITLTGLTGNLEYTFTVKATNGAGQGPASTPSNLVWVPAEWIAPDVTASPAGGSYTGAQLVTLTASEPATIYYTLDNSTPTTASTVYSAPISIGSTTTLKAFAKDTARNPGPVITENYAISSVDLVMATVSKTAASVDVGAFFYVSNAEKNQGSTAMTSTSNVIRFYLSLDGTSTDFVTGDILLTGMRTVSKLLADRVSTTLATKVTVPTTVVPGSYYVRACADGTKVQAETNETNNCMVAGTIEVKKDVDLVMTAVNTGLTTSVHAGSTLDITSTEQNVGTSVMTAARNSISFYLSSISTGTIIAPGDKLLTGTRSVSKLIAGASNTGTRTVTVPKTILPGFYYVRACADATNMQAEINLSGTGETNNCLAMTTQIEVKRDVDLVMAAVSTGATNLSVPVGGSIVIDNTEMNDGTTKMTVSSNRVTFYLSKSGVGTSIASGDIRLTGYRTVSALAAGASSGSALTTAIVPKTVPPSVYYVRACADGMRVQPETNEDNNCKVTTTTVEVIRDVDLVMTAVSTAPATVVAAGATFVIDNTEKNQGTTVMSATSNTIKFYLSLDGTSTNFVTGDKLLTGTRTVSALIAGGSSSAPTTVKVPTTVLPGTYFIRACADATYRQPETFENNNCLAGGQIEVTAP